MLPLLLAPLIATLAKNGLGLLADVVTNKGKEFVESKLGVELKPELSDKELHILKQLEVEHEEFLLEHALKEEQLHSDDRADAREHSAKLATDEDVPLIKKIFPELLALIIICITTVLIILIFSGVVPSEYKELVFLVIGALLGEVTRIMVFHFGSSKGSQDKTKMMDKMMSQTGVLK